MVKAQGTMSDSPRRSAGTWSWCWGHPCSRHISLPSPAAPSDWGPSCARRQLSSHESSSQIPVCVYNPLCEKTFHWRSPENIWTFYLFLNFHIREDTTQICSHEFIQTQVWGEHICTRQHSRRFGKNYIGWQKPVELYAMILLAETICVH